MVQDTSPTADVDGLVSLASPHSVSETIDRLEAVLRDHGVTVFARIDHQAAARDVGLEMHAAQVLVFGNPMIGTPVMQAAPSIAVDLPFKALAWEDGDGDVWLSHTSVTYLARRHHVADEDIAPLAGVSDPIAAAVMQSG